MDMALDRGRGARPAREALRHLAIAFALGAAVAWALGCGSGGSSGSGGSTSYQGPGSHYLVDLADDGTFHIEVADDPTSDAHLVVDGTYERLATGFLDMEVSSATGQDPPSPGDQAIALEIPGFALLLKPLDDGEIIPMVVAGDCPSDLFVGNWFQTSCRDDGTPCDASDTDKGWLGTFAYDPATGMAQSTAEYAVADGSSNDTGDIGAATCADGIMEVDDARVYLTGSGGAIVYTNPEDDANSNHIVAITQETIVASQLAGDYAGLVFEGENDGAFSINASFAANGLSATVYEVDESALDVAANGDAIATLTFSSSNDISTTAVPGWLTGSLDNGEDPARPIYCMADVQVAGSSQDLVLCVGQSPGDPTQHFNVLLVSRP